MKEPIIPFFVADRLVSLRIIKSSGLHKYNVKVGIMGHANTSYINRIVYRIHLSWMIKVRLFLLEKFNFINII